MLFFEEFKWIRQKQPVPLNRKSTSETARILYKIIFKLLFVPLWVVWIRALSARLYKVSDRTEVGGVAVVQAT